MGCVQKTPGLAVPSAASDAADTADVGSFDLDADDTGTVEPEDLDEGPPDTGSGDSGAPPLDGDSGAPPVDCEACTASEVFAVHAIAEDTFVAAPERTRDNPLKGFMTSYLWGEPYNDFPDQMEFLYIPMAQLWNASGDTLESGLEPYLVQAEERGHHAVLRVFVDYPTRPSGLPDYLDGVVSCSIYTEHGGGCSPDYEHPALQEAMFGLISALGDRYDGDPRLGFIQVGLLGFWGEWHTWPHGDWFPSEATQDAILEAYEDAFSVTRLQLRYPVSTSVERRIGFHDDSFAHSTLGDVEWFFLPRMEAAGAADRWQSVPIGGELRPELQGSVYRDDYVLGEYAQDIDECIDQTHATYLLNYYAFNGAGYGYTGEERERAEESALAMGYTFELVGARLEASGLMDGEVDIHLEVDIAQTGVAPFYYPLFLTVAVPGSETTLASDDDLSSVLPGDVQTVRVDLGRLDVGTLNMPFTLGLESDMLIPGQTIAFATLTPGSTDDGSTPIQWSLGCETESGMVTFGQTVGVSEEGCDCVCDVDGALWTCKGEPCE